MINIYGAVQEREDVKSLTYDKDIKYNYPEGLDLKPGSDQHKKLLSFILEQSSYSASITAQRFPEWQKMDKSLIAYKRPDEDEKKVVDNDDQRPISIVFPYSYAILETQLAYMLAAFFQDPIFTYEGYSGDDVVGGILLTKIINLHVKKFKVMLNAHTMFRDGFAYGTGDVGAYWATSPNGFSGNALMNIDQYRSLPDHNVAAHDFQKGESYGWTSDTNYMELLTEEQNNPETIFNVRYLSKLNFRGTSIYGKDNTGRYTKNPKSLNSGQNGVITEIYRYVKLIPAEHKLGSSNYPELWQFRIASDAVIISARPAGLLHNSFPVARVVPDFDGYSSSPIAKLEIVGGLQNVIDFEFNSHIANVRKAVNNTVIVDPSMVNIKDLADGKPGGIVRMKRQAWGQGRIADAVHQLRVDDVTKNNINDVSYIVSNMQTLMGTNPASMGEQRQGGPDRLTKAEFQGTSVGQVSRLKKTAQISGLMAFQDIGELFGYHTQQMLTEEQFIKIAGYQQQLLLKEFGPQSSVNRISRGRMAISPSELDINYDVLVRDGSIPGDGNAGFWAQSFERIAADPQLRQTFDLVKIFKTMGREAGAKNMDDYILRGGGNINPSLEQDETVQQEVQAGNLVPFTKGA